MQQVNTTVNNPVQSPFVLTNLLELASPQGVLLTLKNPLEIMQTFSGVVTETQNILDFQHVRLLQGGIEVDLFVMSSLGSLNGMTPFIKNEEQKAQKADTPRFEQPAEAKYVPHQSTSAQASACRKMIEKEISQIFQYKSFWNDALMANNRLQNLMVVKKTGQIWMHERGLRANMLSEHDQAQILRRFLKSCLDEQLSPDPGKAPPKNLSKACPRVRKEWVQYLILRWQYVEGFSRQLVIRELKKNHYWLNPGIYGRYLKAARKRLSTLIWQKEMQANDPLSACLDKKMGLTISREM